MAYIQPSIIMVIIFFNDCIPTAHYFIFSTKYLCPNMTPLDRKTSTLLSRDIMEVAFIIFLSMNAPCQYFSRATLEIPTYLLHENSVKGTRIILRSPFFTSVFDYLYSIMNDLTLCGPDIFRKIYLLFTR